MVLFQTCFCSRFNPWHTHDRRKCSTEENVLKSFQLTTGAMRMESEEEAHQLFKDVSDDGAENSHSSSKRSAYIALFSVPICVATSLSSAQALGGIVPAFELNALRFVAELTIVIPMIISKRDSIKHERKHLPWLCLVSLMSSIWNICYFSASTHLPVGTLSGMFNGFVLAITALISLFVLRNCAAHLVVAVLICTAGTILLVQPEFIFYDTPPVVYNPVCKPRDSTASNQSQHVDFTSGGTWNGTRLSENVTSSNSTKEYLGPVTDSKMTTSVDELMGYSCLAGAALTTSLNYFIVNHKLNDIHYTLLSLFISVLGIIVSGVGMAIFETVTWPTTVICAFLLLGHCLAASLANMCAQFAMQSIPPVVVSIFCSMNVVVIFAAQYTVMKHINPGKRNLAELLGAILVTIGSALKSVIDLYHICIARRDQNHALQ